MLAHNEALTHKPLALVKVALLRGNEIAVSWLLGKNNSLSML